MKTNKFIAFCLTALLFAGGSGSAFAQGGDAAGGGQDPRMQDPLALYKMAGINTDQEEQIRKVAKDFEDSQRVRVKSLIAMYRELKLLQLQPDPPEEQVLAKQEEVNKLTGEMAIDRIKLLLKVRKILTPEQRKKLVSLLNEESGGGSAPPAGQAGGQ